MNARLSVLQYLGTNVINEQNSEVSSRGYLVNLFAVVITAAGYSKWSRVRCPGKRQNLELLNVIECQVVSG